MTYDIIHKNSTVAGTPPGASDVEIGEIAINAADADFYTKDTNGAINVFSNNQTIATKAAFTQAGTGAKQRTIAGKLQDVVSVLDFIPAGTDTAATDCTTWIQAAINHAQTSGYSTVFVPSGTYLHSGLTISASNISFIGESRETAKLVYAAATGDAINVQSSIANTTLNDIRISDLWLAQDSSQLKTSGAALRLAGVRYSYFTNLFITDIYDGIDTYGLSWTEITDIWYRREFRNSADQANIALALRSGEGLGYSRGTNVKVTRVDATGSAFWVREGFYLDSADWTTFSECHMNNTTTTLRIHVTDLVGNPWFQNCYFDACDENHVRLTGTNTTTKIVDLRFDNCYFRKTEQSTLDIVPGSDPPVVGGDPATGNNISCNWAGTIEGLIFTNCRFANAGRRNIYAVNTTITNLLILGCRFTDIRTEGSATNPLPTLVRSIDAEAVKTTILGCTFLGIKTDTNPVIRVEGDSTTDSSATIVNNDFIGIVNSTGDRITLVGIPRSRRNIGANLGYTSDTEAYGVIMGVAVDNESKITVAHNLATTPDYVDAKVWGSSGLIVHPAGVGATNISFKVFEADGTPAAGVSPAIRWWAKVVP